MRRALKLNLAIIKKAVKGIKMPMHIPDPSTRVIEAINDFLKGWKSFVTEI